MNNLLYRLMYRFTKPAWDSGVTPPEVVQAFEQDSLPPGPALDLGCGTGTNVIYMARQGRRAIGVDFVPQAIGKARRAAQAAGVAGQTQFYVADVAELGRLGLPACAFALDMGCFHGLNAEQQRRYVAGLAALLVPGGRYMLYVLQPHSEGGYRFGVTAQQVTDVFSPQFEITRTEQGSMNHKPSAWYWMTRRGT